MIDGIAFQTNIRALNAAVEAARAGEAREIKTLITASVEQVGHGAKVVRHAGETIGAIVHSAREVNRLLAGIANGADEQAAGVGQTTQAVQDLDRMTQQNAALVGRLPPRR